MELNGLLSNVIFYKPCSKEKFVVLLLLLKLYRIRLLVLLLPWLINLETFLLRLMFEHHAPMVSSYTKNL